MKNKSVIFSLIFVLLLIIIVFLNIRRENKTNIIKVETCQIQKGQLIKQINLLGRVAYKNNLAIYSNISAVLNLLPVKKGDFVKKDQILACLDDTELNESITKCEKELNLAKKRFTENKKSLLKEYNKIYIEYQKKKDKYNELIDLKKTGAISDSSINLAENELNFLEVDKKYYEEKIKEYDTDSIEYIELENIKNQLNQLYEDKKYYIVKSPIFGKIVELATQGNFLQKGQTIIAQIIEPNNIYIQTNVNEYERNLIKLNQEVNISFLSFPNITLTGHIDYIEEIPVIENNIAIYQVHILLNDLTTNLSKQLLSGLTCDIKLNIKSQNNIFYIPITSIYTNQAEKNIIYCINKKNNTVKEISVNLGFKNDKFIEILNDKLQENILILKEQYKNINDGSKIYWVN